MLVRNSAVTNEAPAASGFDNVFSLPAIDVHGHFGINCPFDSDAVRPFGSAEPSEVIQIMRRSNISKLIVSPMASLFPYGKCDVVNGNTAGLQAAARYKELLQWVVVNPLDPRTYSQAEEMFKNRRAVGIKIHPVAHMYSIKEKGRQIFEFAAKHRLIVLTHSGDAESLPQDFVPFANYYPDVKLILAHLGASPDEDRMLQVKAVESSKNGNIYVDTSSAMNILTNVMEDAVKRIGPDNILFGSDTPLYFTAMQRVRIEFAEISDAAKKKILRENAVRLFGSIVEE
jgi:predicted TIM-barrel fold metal-dependent hydrolase